MFKFSKENFQQNNYDCFLLNRWFTKTEQLTFKDTNVRSEWKVTCVLSVPLKWKNRCEIPKRITWLKHAAFHLPSSQKSFNIQCSQFVLLSFIIFIDTSFLEHGKRRQYIYPLSITLRSLTLPITFFHLPSYKRPFSFPKMFLKFKFAIISVLFHHFYW